MKPIIGITASFSTQDCMVIQRPDYFDTIERAGGIPILLPLTDDLSVLSGILSKIDGLIFSGGPDVDPAYFGEFPWYHCGQVEPIRDKNESAIWKLVKDTDLPILAICRGMQFVNVMMGGTLYQDLTSQMPGLEKQTAHKQTKERCYGTHEISTKPGTFINECYGGKAFVNSFHHQGVKELAEGLTATAWSPDGLVESAELEGPRFFKLVQWHPESMYTQDENSRNLFAAFVEACEI